jgi:cell division protein FtsN
MKVVCPQCRYENETDASHAVCCRCATIIAVSQSGHITPAVKSISAEQPPDLQRRVTKPMSTIPESPIPKSSPRAPRRDPYATRIEPDILDTDEVLDIPLLSNGSAPVADTGAVLDEVLPIPAQNPVMPEMLAPIQSSAADVTEAASLPMVEPIYPRGAETQVTPPDEVLLIPQLLEPAVSSPPQVAAENAFEMPAASANESPATVSARSAETIVEPPMLTPVVMLPAALADDDSIVEEIPLDAVAQEPAIPVEQRAAESNVLSFENPITESVHRLHETVSEATESLPEPISTSFSETQTQMSAVTGTFGNLKDAVDAASKTAAETTENTFGSLREAVTKNAQDVYDPLRNFIVVEPSEASSGLNIAEPLPPHSPEMQQPWAAQIPAEDMAVPVAAKSNTLMRALLGLLLFVAACGAAWYFFKDRFMQRGPEVAVVPKPPANSSAASAAKGNSTGGAATATGTDAASATNANAGTVAGTEKNASTVKPGAAASPSVSSTAAPKVSPEAKAAGAASAGSDTAAKIPAARSGAGETKPPAVPAGPSGQSVSSSDGSLTLQVASYSTQKQADAKAASLRGDGVEARVMSVNLPGRGTWYRVQIGRFTNHEEARQFAAKLRARGRVQDFIITGLQSN